MKSLALICICISLFSCASLQVSQTRSRQNVTDIGIDWNYSDEVDERYKPMADSTMAVAITNFNSEKHLFKIHKKMRKDKDYVTVEFTKGKIMGPGQKAAGYIITTLGIAAIPALVVAESPIIVGFYFIPQNSLESKISLSPSLAADKYRDKKTASYTGALFSSQKIQVPKVGAKYAASFKQILIDLEKKIEVNG
jgi:hypothetical protein